MIYRILLAGSFLCSLACSSSPERGREKLEKTKLPEKLDQKEKLHTDFIFRETLVKGLDTSMIQIRASERMNIDEVICQKWVLVDMSGIDSIEQVMDDNEKRIFREFSFFKDGEALENPRSHLRIGKWKAVIEEDKLLLVLTFGTNQKTYIIRAVSATKLLLGEEGKNGSLLKLELHSDGLRHENMLNDPFHPANNKWRIKPLKKETNQQIHERAKSCVRFFALYFRDNIKRQDDEISFLGLPSIFKWYSGGIGVPERIEVDESWWNCFYNKDQAMQGYQIMRKLITDNRFIWPDNAPNWVYQTHNVLEQMYAKMEEGL